MIVTVIVTATATVPHQSVPDLDVEVVAADVARVTVMTIAV